MNEWGVGQSPTYKARITNPRQRTNKERTKKSLKA
jgi:hypothetical protein